MGVCALVLVGALASGVALVDVRAPPAPLGRDLQVLVDDSGALDVDGARASDAWQPARSSEVTFGLHKAVLWVRFDVDLVSGDDWLLWARFPRPRTLEHWAFDDDGVLVAHATSGDAVLRGDRPIDDAELLLPLSRGRHHLLRAEARPARLNLLVGSRAAISEARADDGVAAGLYYGIFVGLFCFNLAFGFATKDRSHLLYCLFVVCMGLHMAVRDGWLPPYLPEAIFGRGGGMPLTGLAMLAFTRRFLDIDVALPSFRRVYGVALAGSAVLAALPFTGLDLARPAAWWTLGNILLVFVSGVVLSVKGDRPALLFLLAWTLMIAFSLLGVCHALGVIDFPWAARSGVRVGAATEMIVLSLALAARVGVLRQARDVAERGLHEARLTRQREILQKILATQESERERFARDLHDGLGHQLLLLKQQAAATPALKEGLGDALDDVRRLARALAPATLERLGLISALRALCEQHEKSTGVAVVFDCGLVDDDVSAFGEHAIHCYRIVQEALANATRHGAAQKIDVDVSKEGAGVRVHVVDDGCGADVDDAGRVVWGTGLTGMDQRARLLGGTFTFTTSERGSAVDVVVPFPVLAMGAPA